MKNARGDCVKSVRMDGLWYVTYIHKDYVCMGYAPNLTDAVNFCMELITKRCEK